MSQFVIVNAYIMAAMSRELKLHNSLRSLCVANITISIMQKEIPEEHIGHTVVGLELLMRKPHKY